MSNPDRRYVTADFMNAVRRLHPGIRFIDQVVIRDASDGAGPYLAAWNVEGDPPTDAEVVAALAVPVPEPTVDDKIDAMLAANGLTLAELADRIKRAE